MELIDVVCGVNYLKQWSLIAMLPVEYRPRNNVCCTGVYEDQDTSICNEILFRIRRDGGVEISSNQNLQSGKMTITISYIGEYIGE